MMKNFKKQSKKIFIYRINSISGTKKKRKEEDVWNGLPSANDKYMGITKRTGEIFARFQKEFNWNAVKL